MAQIAPPQAPGISWQRGLFRLWVIGSACWLLLVVEVASNEIWLTRAAASLSQVYRYATVAAVPIVGFFALGAIATWFIASFNPTRR